jgi:hypothetical protein
MFAPPVLRGFQNVFIAREHVVASGLPDVSKGNIEAAAQEANGFGKVSPD